MARNAAVTLQDLDKTKAVILQELHGFGKLVAERLRSHLAVPEAQTQCTTFSRPPSDAPIAACKGPDTSTKLPRRNAWPSPKPSKDDHAAPLVDGHALEALFRHRVAHEPQLVALWQQELEQRLQEHSPTPGSTPRTGSSNSPASTCPTSPLPSKPHRAAYSRFRTPEFAPAPAVEPAYGPAAAPKVLGDPGNASPQPTSPEALRLPLTATQCSEAQCFDCRLSSRQSTPLPGPTPRPSASHELNSTAEPAWRSVAPPGAAAPPGSAFGHGCAAGDHGDGDGSIGCGGGGGIGIGSSVGGSITGGWGSSNHRATERVGGLARGEADIVATVALRWAPGTAGLLAAAREGCAPDAGGAWGSGAWDGEGVGDDAPPPRRELPLLVVQQIKRQHVLALIEACGPRSGGAAAPWSGPGRASGGAFRDASATAGAATGISPAAGAGAAAGAPPLPPPSLCTAAAAPPPWAPAPRGARPPLAPTPASAAAASVAAAAADGCSGRASPDSGECSLSATASMQSTQTTSTWCLSAGSPSSQGPGSALPSRSGSSVPPSSCFPSPRGGA